MKRLALLWRVSAWWMRITAIIFVALIVQAAINMASPDKVQSIQIPQAPKAAVLVAPTAADIAKKANADRLEMTFQKVALFANTIKGALRDPDSVVWESIHANEDASIICIEYRAKNGFGGMNREFALYANKKISQKPESWNKHCTKPLVNMRSVKHAIR